MKQALILFTSLFISAGSIAQEIIEPPKSTTDNYFLASLEGGISLVGIGDIQLSNGTLPTIISATPDLQIRFSRVMPKWSYGLRAEIAV